ncbi:MAG: XRE family transcriptional regulator [Clostridia bacterium]|nr:XRE family transcriptional regulator [Oscillospiraceae bacterium]MBR6693810.1 XRE family transcriptional regulator [Clostridia bacterium]
MAKDTTKIVEELGLCSDFKTFYNENKEYMVKGDLSQLLDELIIKHNLKKSQVIRAAEMSEVYAYQIFSGLRVPERKKLLCIAIAMGLTLDEAQTLLKSAGYSTLYVKLPFDSVVLYGICKKLSVVEINEILYEYGLETLG